jgi:hypothetical protein
MNRWYYLFCYPKRLGHSFKGNLLCYLVHDVMDREISTGLLACYTDSKVAGTGFSETPETPYP